jgi:hypothetical protein
MALLKFKRSAVPAKVPALNDLDLGELAINTYDGKVYTKKDDGTPAIVEIGGVSGGVITNTTIDSITNHVGADHIHYKVKATENLVKGNVVKVIGYNAGEDAFRVAKVTSASDVAIGVVYQAIADGDYGSIINTGVLEGVNTSAFAIGTVLYPNTTGGFTSTKPTTGKYQALAFVVRSGNNNGTILIEASEPQPTSLSQFTNDSGYITGITSGNVTTALGYTPVNRAGDTMTGQLSITGMGNVNGGNLQLGDKAEGTNKWSVMTGGHYNGVSQAKGVMLIGSYSNSTANQVSIGGNVWEANPATQIVFYTSTTTTHATGGTSRLSINGSGNVVAEVDIRAPIYYDSNDTAYYVDPNSNSNFIVVYASEFYNRGWFRTNDSDKGLYNQATGQHWYSDSGNYWNMGGGNLNGQGIRFRDNHQGTVRGYVYYDQSNNVGFLNNEGNWRARVVGGDYFLADGSSARAQIFYDSNDTTYYINGAGDSVLNTLYMRNGTVQAKFAQASNFGYSSSYKTVVLGNEYLTTISMGVDVSGNASGSFNGQGEGREVLFRNGVTFVTPNSANNNYLPTFNMTDGYVTSGGSVRSPIFYDSNNTAFYTDPASTSVLNNLSVNGSTVFRSDWTTRFQSPSDFVDGTLVTTDIPATGWAGDSFVIEITGKSYDQNNPPFKVIAQGYLYNDTIINYSGISYAGNFASYIKVFQDGGVLKFWWPRISYWNSFNVNVMSMDGQTNGTITRNRVTAIGNSTEPTGTKKQQINLIKFLRSTETAAKATDLNQARYVNNDFNTLGTSPQVFRAYSNYIPSGGSYNQPPNGAGDYKVLQWGDVEGGSSGNWGGQIVQNFYDDRMWFRRSYGTTWQAWREFIHDGNYTTYAMPSGASATNSVDVRAPIFYDSNNTAFYIDPSSNFSVRAAYLNGNILINPQSESYGEGIAFLMPSQGTWGGLRWKRSNSDFTGAWAFGYFGNETNNDIGFHNGTNGWRLDHSFNNTVNGSFRAPIFYDSNDTGYYIDPTGTSLTNVMRADKYHSLYSGGQPSPRFDCSFYVLQSQHWYSHNGASTMYVGEGGDFVYIRGYTQADGSSRAPIFYDSDNTGYYWNFGDAAISNINTVITGVAYYRSNLGSSAYSGAQSSPTLQVYSSDAGTAMFSFHRAGYYAVNMGLDPDNVLRIGGWSASANRFQMDMSGNLTMAGNVTAYSDARLKKDVSTVTNALELVGKMRGVTYTRTDTGEAGVGVIAQEMLEVMPQVVQQGIGDDDTLSVAYGNLVGVLIEAIKELSLKVKTLEEKDN